MQMQKLEAESKQAEQRQQVKMLQQWKQAHSEHVSSLQTRLKVTTERLEHLEHGQATLKQQGAKCVIYIYV